MKPIQFELSVPRNLTHELPIKIARPKQPIRPIAGHATLWAGTDVPLIKVGNHGYIIGLVFSRHSAKRISILPDEALVNDGAQAIATWLMHECWGGYVAILMCARTKTVNLFVDPSGLCPVYRTDTESNILISTHPAHLNKFGTAPLSVSWPALHSFLLRPELRKRETCLTGVTELSPGELVSLSGTHKESQRMWKAENFSPHQRRGTFAEASEQLAYLSQQICGAWGKVFGHCIVAASGGVDSSLICAALAVAGVPFSCATVATSDPSGDERRFVEMLAQHLRVDVITAIYDLSLIDPLCAVSLGLARPSRKAFMTALENALFEAAAQTGAKVVLDGNGGDNLFCFLHSAAPVVDRLRCEGLGLGAISTFHDMCLITRCDMPTMARALARRWLRRDGVPSWPVDPRLLSQNFPLQENSDPLTPWLLTPVGRHGGKRDHLALIMRAQMHMHGLAASGLPRFSPLASQPLLEFCLGVPTWLWCQGGTNRALARAAFAADLPEEIVKRTSKAGPDSFIHKTFYAHRDMLREHLMDGLLAHHGIIDRDAVDESFQTGVHSDREIVLRLLDLAEAESWARSWQA